MPGCGKRDGISLLPDVEGSPGAFVFERTRSAMVADAKAEVAVSREGAPFAELIIGSDGCESGMPGTRPIIPAAAPPSPEVAATGCAVPG